MYEYIYGLSCVENHVLAVLRSRGLPVEYTYHDSAVPMRELYDSMIRHGVRPEYFGRIRRVQDTLREMGVISLMKSRAEGMEQAKREIRGCRENEYILMRVTPGFTRTVLSARGFRPDHYALVQVAGNGFEIYNDIPERVVPVTAQFSQAYDGGCFRLAVLRNMNEADAGFLWRIRGFRPERYEPSYFRMEDFAGIEDAGVRLRNMAGVYKLLRCRMAEYYGMYVDTGFIRDALPEADRCYARFEYYNLRGSVPLEKYYELFCELNDADNAMMNELKARLEAVHDS